MGIREETNACKLEKSSSPQTEQEHQQQHTSVHVYPDWAAMQAYYGPRMAVPPYFNSAVASGHGPPPYVWGPPQHMMPPYAAFYPHGGVYAHPGVTIAASPPNVDSPAKSSENSDQRLMKKSKVFDGLAISVGNGHGDGAEGGNGNVISHSGETDSSEGSDGNTTEEGQIGKKRSREESPIRSEVGKAEPQPDHQIEVLGKVTEPVLSPNPITELSLKNSPFLPDEVLLQNDRELKKERRKQSNRESARRSRLRKQVEAEDLAVKVEALNSENLTLRSEINRLTDDSEKLKLQNVELMEKLKNAQKGGITEEPMHLSTVNLLSGVDNGSGEEVYDNDKKKPDSGSRLRQLLDAVAAR